MSCTYQSENSSDFRRQTGLCDIPTTSYTLFTLAQLAMAERGSVYTGRLYPRQTGQPRENCLGEDLGEGQV